VIVNVHSSWRCSIANWILIVPWLATAGVLLTVLFRPISVTSHCFVPVLVLGPCPVIEIVIERTNLRPAFRLVMGFARKLMGVPLFDDWRFNRCMGG